MFEVLTHYRARSEASDVLQRLELDAGYFVVSAHREENVMATARSGLSSDAVAEDHGLPLIVSTHPRTWSRSDIPRPCGSSRWDFTTT